MKRTGGAQTTITQTAVTHLRRDGDAREGHHAEQDDGQPASSVRHHYERHLPRHDGLPPLKVVPDGGAGGSSGQVHPPVRHSDDGEGGEVQCCGGLTIISPISQFAHKLS